jgi:uncharacterized protein (DUF433 family)
MVTTNWREYIVSTPGVLRGRPRVDGTKIPVSLVLGYFAAGYTAAGVIEEYPDLNLAQVQACLDYARELSELKDIVS